MHKRDQEKETMSKQLRFDGRVAIVTGAGGGLGRSHALLLASRGAKVVVNDLGGSFIGEGKSSSAADQVVAEIKDRGGEAVANYHSVEDGDQIVKTAIDTWGKIDILINNAGILRDVSFQKMTREDWDLVYKVHVLGAFRTTHAAWSYMRDAGYGRVILTASAAGIYGNFGQANYSMAKLGLHGFAQTLALEGRKRNIVVNTIAPIAGSRMTETVLPPALIEALKPELVSPLVAKLVHESNEDTGGLYEVGGGFFAKLRWERSTGKTFRLGRTISIEDVDTAWKRITQFDETTHPESVALSMQPIMENVEAGPSKGGNEFIDVDAALGYKYPDFPSSYDERDVALYALGVGAAKDLTDENDLDLVYELSGRGMKVLPSFGVLPAINEVFTLGRQGYQAPGLHFGLDRTLHGEQYTEVKRPLPTKASLTTKATVKSIYDKGKGAVVTTEFVTYDETGDELVRNELTTFVRGAGGWGGERGPSADVNLPPDRAPDKVIEDKTSENQALLYRLSGDWNPLHADPGFAKAFGFSRPILHGLCSFGYATRHVARGFAPHGDPRYIKSIKVRFASTVFPGETIVTEMWKESDTRIVFRCKIKERNEVCMSNAAIDLWQQLPMPKALAETTKRTAAADPATRAEPTTSEVFAVIEDYLKSNPELAGKVGNVYLWKIGGQPWILDLKNGSGAVNQGDGAADCTLEIAERDFLDMTRGKADAMKLFTTGKLKISGNVMASQKLEFLRKLDPNRAVEVVAKLRGASGGGGKAAAATPMSTAAPQAPRIFAALVNRLAETPGLKQEVRATVKFDIKDPDAAQTVELGGADRNQIDVTLTIADADFAALASGKTDAKSLFQHGKLRVDGDVSVAHRLGFLKGLI
jgi:3-hydroxyacyl-CoA dehydrogenase/3a,7a,12a-trihydroxy-5b-cholest-24-enoyl-CoA hydratase